MYLSQILKLVSIIPLENFEELAQRGEPDRRKKWLLLKVVTLKDLWWGGFAQD